MQATIAMLSVIVLRTPHSASREQGIRGSGKHSLDPLLTHVHHFRPIFSSIFLRMMAKNLIRLRRKFRVPTLKWSGRAPRSQNSWYFVNIKGRRIPASVKR
eukprot:scaffold22022_cov147-Skeletonema_menzelii.AAC.4